MKTIGFIITIAIYKFACYAINFHYNPFSDGIQVKNLLIDAALFLTIAYAVYFVIKKIETKRSQETASDSLN